MTEYTEEQFVYFTTALTHLEFIKDDRDAYWYEYKKLQDWLETQELSTAFISWVEQKVKNNLSQR
ncbi:hypothetical protein [Bacillus sp. TH13]|uniref:hypothetical protein n=1 Tax=Bacillus sp. TH13 TaxID=2796379 RepID=UPI00191316A2|nr:hypothetical protein [Bacillus sp. TH13]MBK5491762.1 hypothetical protein [Bacillus sp. TH13]